MVSIAHGLYELVHADHDTFSRDSHVIFSSLLHPSRPPFRVPRLLPPPPPSPPSPILRPSLPALVLYGPPPLPSSKIRPPLPVLRRPRAPLSFSPSSHLQEFCEKWDQASFCDDYESLPLEFFTPMVERVFARDAYWWDPSHPKAAAVTGAASS